MKREAKDCQRGQRQRDSKAQIEEAARIKAMGKAVFWEAYREKPEREGNAMSNIVNAPYLNVYVVPFSKFALFAPSSVFSLLILW